MRLVVTFDLVANEICNHEDLFSAIAANESSVVLDLQYVARMDRVGLDALDTLVKRRQEFGRSTRLSWWPSD